MNTNISLPSLLSSRDCILQIHTFSDYIHQSWLLDDGKVISFENIPDNYPSGSLAVWDTMDDYIEAIAEVDWINDPDYIVHHSLDDWGFPFWEEEEDEEQTLLQAPSWGTESI